MGKYGLRGSFSVGGGKKTYTGYGSMKKPTTTTTTVQPARKKPTTTTTTPPRKKSPVGGSNMKTLPIIQKRKPTTTTTSVKPKPKVGIGKKIKKRVESYVDKRNKALNFE